VPAKGNTIETPFQRSQKYRIGLAITGTATEHANQMDTVVFIFVVSFARTGTGRDDFMNAGRMFRNGV
jgi:hypothetical protein